MPFYPIKTTKATGTALKIKHSRGNNENKHRHLMKSIRISAPFHEIRANEHQKKTPEQNKN